MVKNDENMTLRIAGIVPESVVDGTGIRFTLFVQGCKHACKGCHNPDTHALDGGEETTTSEILKAAEKNPLLDGMTFSGGEPFLQPVPLATIAKAIHERGLNVWCYSGYTFEELLGLSKTDEGIRALFESLDVLVDGRYIESKRNLMLKFRGSENQRILDMKKSRAAGFPVLLEDSE